MGKSMTKVTAVTKEIKSKALEEFFTDCFENSGMNYEDAKITTDVLLEADRRGISSHGAARLRLYIDCIKNGIMIPDAQYEIIKETPNTLLASGHGGLGQPVSYKVMKLVIEKAKKNDIAVATVRNSNHYGIAGYYAMMALPENLIGFSLTNSSPLVVPTFSKSALLGTNPIAVAVPMQGRMDFVLDMATSTVTRGKLEEFDRKGKSIPGGWATDTQGRLTTDPGLVLKNVVGKFGGGLLPLGGASEELGGHKGFGLAMLVEIFTGILSGGAFGPHVWSTNKSPANVCHLFGAINIEAFLPLDDFKSSLSSFVKTLHDSAKAAGQDRSYVHGEKEFHTSEKQREYIKIADIVIKDIKAIGESLGVEADF